MPRAVSILPTVDLPMPIEPVSATFIMPPPLSSGLSCGQHRDVVIGQLAVAGHQDQVLGLRLGDQHAVEGVAMQQRQFAIGGDMAALQRHRSEEHTSELQSLMRTSYAVFCLNKKNNEDLMSQSDPHINTEH